MALREIAALACAMPAILSAGVIHGVVVEHSSSRPVARARVKLEALSGNRLEQVATMLSNRSGQFTFLSLPDGYYVLSAVRAGFAVASYGQKRNNAPGAPIPVTRDSVTFAEVRLQRLGAVSGRIVDENGVGMPDIPVVAYPVALPLRIAASSKADDRGVYRIGGLAPGRYYVRTGPYELEDGVALWPTFSLESAVAKEARILAVDLEREAPDVEVRPMPGRLIRLTVRVTGCRAAANLTLSSDTGRKQARVTPCPSDHVFDGLSPGNYELLAEEPEVPLGGFQDLFLDRDRESVTIQLVSQPTVFVQIEERDHASLRLKDVPVLVRRKDLAGESLVTRISAENIRLAPGFWEFTAQPPSTRYLVSIAPQIDRRRASKAGDNPDWYEVFLGIADYSRIRVALSSRPASLTGKVASERAPVPGAPVYLYPITSELRKRMNGNKTALSDPQGMYRFDGLAPGRYLVLSSFDLTEINEETLTNARAETVLLEEGQAGVRDLVLY